MRVVKRQAVVVNAMRREVESRKYHGERKPKVESAVKRGSRRSISSGGKKARHRSQPTILLPKPVHHSRTLPARQKLTIHPTALHKHVRDYATLFTARPRSLLHLRTRWHLHVSLDVHTARVQNECLGSGVDATQVVVVPGATPALGFLR